MKRKITLAKLVALCILAGPFSSQAAADSDLFRPFAGLHEIISDDGDVLEGTSNLCCMADPANGQNGIVNHLEGKEFTRIGALKKTYRKELKKAKRDDNYYYYQYEGPIFQRAMVQRSFSRKQRNPFRRKFAKFRRQAKKCLQGKFPYRNQDIYSCDSFVSMIGGQGKLSPSGEVTIVFEKAIQEVAGEKVNFFAGSKDDINRRFLFELSTRGQSFPTDRLTFQLSSEQCQTINQTRDFNMAVPQRPIDATYQGDFTELGNECELRC